MVTPACDRVGTDYSDVRRADPRIEAAICQHFGTAQSVLDVGAGTGSYELLDREVSRSSPPK